MKGWLPITDAPRDGTGVLLLYPSGRVEIGRWKHSVHTTNGKVTYDRAGWTVRANIFDTGPASEPAYYALIPTLPPRDEQGYVNAPIPSEAQHA